MRTVWASIVLCVVAVLAAGEAPAVELMADDAVNVPKEARVPGDVLAAGNQVNVEGGVAGDVTAAGDSVTVTGPVGYTAILAGRNVTLSNGAGNDVWAAGQNVSVSGRIADNAYLAGNRVMFEDSGSVGGDLLAAGSLVYVGGSVRRNARLAGENIRIAGTVNGNVYADGTAIHILKDAVIRGNLHYESRNKARIDPGAQILGRTFRSIPPRERAWPVFWSRFIMWIGSLAAILLFGAAVLALFPAASEAAATTARASFWSSLGIGLVILIVTPISCVLAAITLIGIPLALAVLAVYLVLVYASRVFAGLALGRWILQRAGVGAPGRFTSMIVGLVALWLLGLIPFVGWIIMFAALLTGLGALIVSWWRGRTAPETAPAQV